MLRFSRTVFTSSLLSFISIGVASASGHEAAMNHAVASAQLSSTGKADAKAGYVPTTKYDNTPWRFNMNQNGKKMTAEEFDAWMKSRGIHVVKAHPATNQPAAVNANASNTQPSGQ